jgi:glutamate dehydrogenase/leucine dehydrogenase
MWCATPNIIPLRFWDAQEVYDRLARVMKTAFGEVLRIHLDRKVNMRLGVSRVADACKIRGLYP